MSSSSEARAARASRVSSPEWARRAYEMLLRVSPWNESARTALGRLTPEKPERDPRFEPLVKKDRLRGWDPGTTGMHGWSVRRGVVRCDPTDTKWRANLAPMRATAAALSVTRAVAQPIRAAARAASHPAWPAPTTIRS